MLILKIKIKLGLVRVMNRVRDGLTTLCILSMGNFVLPFHYMPPVLNFIAKMFINIVEYIFLVIHGN